VNSGKGKIELANGILTFERGVEHELMLLDVILPIMKYSSIPKGTTLIHASAVAKKGKSFLFPAWRGTGKTSTLLTFLQRHYDYVSDDWVFLTKSGHALALPRHILINERHLEVFPDILDAVGDEAKKEWTTALRKIRFGMSIRGNNIISRIVRFCLVDRTRFEPRIAPQDIRDDLRIEMKSKVSKVFLLTKSRNDSSIDEISPRELRNRLVASSAYEWSTSSYLGLMFAQAYSQRTVWNPMMELEGGILEDALSNVALYEVRFPSKYSRETLESIADRIEEL
jgi:hypothetical protein